MAELILRGKAGPPTVRKEGTAIIVKKNIAGATIEERTPTTRVTGKQSATTGTHTAGELRAAMKYVNGMANDMLANVSLAKKELTAKSAKDMKGINPLIW
jgi:hypothetical protein